MKKLGLILIIPFIISLIGLLLYSMYAIYIVSPFLCCVAISFFLFVIGIFILNKFDN